MFSLDHRADASRRLVKVDQTILHGLGVGDLLQHGLVRGQALGSKSDDGGFQTFVGPVLVQFSEASSPRHQRAYLPSSMRKLCKMIFDSREGSEGTQRIASVCGLV